MSRCPLHGQVDWICKDSPTLRPSGSPERVEKWFGLYAPVDIRRPPSTAIHRFDGSSSERGFDVGCLIEP
jgi:hypothetical protein